MSGAQSHAGQRLVRDGNRQPGGVTQHQIEIAKQRAAAGQHNTFVDDISRNNGWSVATSGGSERRRPIRA